MRPADLPHTNGRVDTATLTETITQQIHRGLPDTAEPVIRNVLSRVSLTTRGLAVVHRHLRAHPDALTSGDPNMPPTVAAVTRQLIDAGAATALPRCSHCGQPRRRLPFPVPNGRICKSCAYAKTAPRCARCGEQTATKRCRSRDGARLCAACWPPRARACAHCHRTRRILTRWPLGEVCGSCYKHIRAHPAACTSCHAIAPLIGRTSTGAGLCPSCANDPRSYTCLRCGTAGFFLTSGHCPRCQLTDRLTQLFGPADALREDVAPFVTALATADSPTSVLAWLAPHRPAAGLLSQLLQQPAPLTHAALDTLPPTLTLHHLRQSLTHTGVLQTRPDDLARLDPWLDHLLEEQPATRAAPLRAYAQWCVLRRSRQRARQHHFTRGSAIWSRTRIRAALALLAWLDDHNIVLANLSQHDLDRWVLARPSTASDAREFIHWTRKRGLTQNLSIPKRRPQLPTSPLTDDARWHHLRRCIHDDSLPLAVRTAGALSLLYGIPLTRISNLRSTDIHTDTDGSTSLQLGRHRLRVVPTIADLIHRQQTTATSTATLHTAVPQEDPWLFPGGFPGAPARYLLGRGLRQHGIPHLTRARASALIALATDIPPAVLATLLDINVQTAIGWARYAQTDWTAYLEARINSAPEN